MDEPEALDLSDDDAAGGLVADELPSPPKGNLSDSQRAAIVELRHFYRLHKTMLRVDGIDPRPVPLVVAPSGAGKTYLLQYFAAEQAMPLMQLTPSTWIVAGAHIRPGTLETLAKWVDANPRGCINIDELDKAGGAGLDSPWMQHVRAELFAFLDKRLLGSHGWEARLIRKLRRFFVTGCGTWQAEFRAKAPLGFGGVKSRPDILRQTIVPEELLFRFNSELIYLCGPTATEFAQRIVRLHAALKRPIPHDLARIAHEAVESNLNARWLEAYLSKLLRTAPAVGARIAARIESAERRKQVTGEAPNDV